MSKKKSRELKNLLKICRRFDFNDLEAKEYSEAYAKEYNKNKLETHEIEMIKVLLNCGKFTSEEIASQFNVTREKIREIYKEK